MCGINGQGYMIKTSILSMTFYKQLFSLLKCVLVNCDGQTIDCLAWSKEPPNIAIRIRYRNHSSLLNQTLASQDADPTDTAYGIPSVNLYASISSFGTPCKWTLMKLASARHKQMPVILCESNLQIIQNNRSEWATYIISQTCPIERTHSLIWL